MRKWTNGSDKHKFYHIDSVNFSVMIKFSDKHKLFGYDEI